MVQQRKKFSINFTKENTKFSLSLHYHSDQSYFYVKTTETYEFEVHDNVLLYGFCLGNVPKVFTKDEMSGLPLNCTVYNFPVDHSPTEKEDILNIHKYLVKQNEIK